MTLQYTSSEHIEHFMRMAQEQMKMNDDEEHFVRYENSFPQQKTEQSAMNIDVDGKIDRKISKE